MKKTIISKKVYKITPNGICHNITCNKEVKDNFVYCYTCNLEKVKTIHIKNNSTSDDLVSDSGSDDKKDKFICTDCNKNLKGNFKRCYECNIKFKSI